MLKLNMKKYITVIAVLLLLLFLHYSKLSAPVENFLNIGLKPALNIFYGASAGLNRTYRDQTSDKLDLAAQLKQAKAQINQLTAENAKLKFLQDENSELRKHLNFLNNQGGRYLMADVITRGDLAGGNAVDNQVITIDKGAKDGLFDGLAVLSGAAVGTSSRGVIIGKLMGVKDHISQVYLATNKNSKIAASILGETKTSGIARGELGLTIRMDFIPQTENIKVGDIAATSGLEQNIPRGLVIGRVSHVKRENNDVWQSASIEPLENLDALSIVSVLVP